MFEALKTIRVQTPNGRVEVRNKGDLVPEALGWKYVYKWIDNGSIRPVAGTVKVEPRKASVEMVKCSECSRLFKTSAGMKRHKGVVHRKG